MAVGDVAIGQLAGGAQSLIGYLNLVVLFVTVTQPFEDLNRLLDRWLVNDDLLETTLQRAVALEVLAVLVERRRADRLQLATSQGRFKD